MSERKETAAEILHGHPEYPQPCLRLLKELDYIAAALELGRPVVIEPGSVMAVQILAAVAKAKGREFGPPPAEPLIVTTVDQTNA